MFYGEFRLKLHLNLSYKLDWPKELATVVVVAVVVAEVVVAAVAVRLCAHKTYRSRRRLKEEFSKLGPNQWVT